MKTKTIDDFIRLHQKKGCHWFDKETIRFFKSNYGPLYSQKYFISSEKGPYSNRKWTIRKINWNNGKVDTVGEFQKFNTEKQAQEYMRKKLRIVI
jgi:hypothetical protein